MKNHEEMSKLGGEVTSKKKRPKKTSNNLKLDSLGGVERKLFWPIMENIS